MFSFARKLLVLVCLTIAVSGSLPNAIAQQADDDEVLRVNTDLLVFPVRIRDKQKRPASLTEKDLSLKDPDGVTAGLYLYHGVDRVALVFALDQSGSTREIISQQRNAAVGLFERFGERSKIAVITFAETPRLVADFGRDSNIARQAFITTAARDQHTAIFDAAMSSIRSFESLPRVRSERRIVILISDGLDNASTNKQSTVIESAIKARVSFYVIHLPLFEPRDGRLAVRGPSSGFKDLAEKTGGKYFLASDASTALIPKKEYDLGPIFQSIEDDLRSQYLLGFYLNDKANDGRKHRFSLSLPEGFEYQVGRFGYSRKQEFFVDRPREALKSLR